MEVTDRVHVLAHGWEVARIVEPLYELKADKVVLILPPDDDYMADFEFEMLNELEAMDRIDVEVRSANLFDLDSALQTFTQAVKDHEGNDIYINVSTGSQIAAIAGMMASQTSDATPYFVQHNPAGLDPEDVETPEKPIFEGAGDISELPVFELDGPSSEQLQVLGYLFGNKGATKKELIEYAESEALPFIANTEAESDEGRYRLLESHIINPLRDKEYITVEKAGREKKVHIEDRGVDALAAFPLESDTLDAVEAASEETPDDFFRSKPVPWDSDNGARNGTENSE